jgi:hypothetical protein
MSNGSAQNLNSIRLPFQREDVVTEHETAFVCSLCYLSRPLNVCFWQILLKKSFLADEQNFSGPLMRSARGDVREHIVLYKNDHGPSYRA